MTDPTRDAPAPAGNGAAPPPSAAARPQTHWKFALGALVVAAAGFFAVTIGGIGENLIYYWGPKEIVAAGPKAVGAAIRLGGQVAAGTVKRTDDASLLEFEVTDGTERVRVRSSGSPPAMFREGIGVVVEGTMTEGGVFESSRLLVSHDNEYRAPKDGGSVDVQAMMTTTEGLAEEGAAKP